VTRRDDADREWLTKAELRPPRPVGDALDGLARRLGVGRNDWRVIERLDDILGQHVPRHLH